jgi:hypothetical protein
VMIAEGREAGSKASRYGPVVDSCEQGKELSGYMKGGGGGGFVT